MKLEWIKPNPFFEKMVLPKVKTALNQDSKTSFNKFYIFGSKSSGKTSWLLWLIWDLVDSKTRYNFIWARNMRADALQTFDWLVSSIPKDFQNKIKIDGRRLTFSVYQCHFFVKCFNSSKRHDNRLEMFNTGEFLPYSDYNILIFDEAYQINQLSIKSLIASSSKNVFKGIISFYLFNSWSILNWLVAYVSQFAPYVDKLMKDPKISFIEGFNKAKKEYFLRLNWQAIKFFKGSQKLLNNTIIDGLKESVGTPQERVTLWGDNGISKALVFSAYIDKINWTTEQEIRSVFRRQDRWKIKHWVVGIDLAHLRDNSAFVLGCFDKFYEKLILVDILLFEMLVDPMSTETQMEQFLKWLQSNMNKWMINDVVLALDNLASFNYSLDNKIKYWKLGHKIELKYLMSKTKGSSMDVLTRLNNHKQQIDTGNMFVNHDNYENKFKRYHMELLNIDLQHTFSTFHIVAQWNDVVDAVENILALGRVNTAH